MEWQSVEETYRRFLGGISSYVWKLSSDFGPGVRWLQAFVASFVVESEEIYQTHGDDLQLPMFLSSAKIAFFESMPFYARELLFVPTPFK